jgi:hypothetical protein
MVNTTSYTAANILWSFLIFPVCLLATCDDHLLHIAYITPLISGKGSRMWTTKLRNFHHSHFSIPSRDQIHVKWVHCHHGMARPRVADRGYGLQVWRVAANILNKQSRTADSGWSSSPGVGRGANNPSRKTHYLLRITTHRLRTGRISWHNLSNGKWTWDLVHGMLGAFIGQVHLKR